MSANGPEIDKEQLYGKFQASANKRDRLMIRAAHKALDIPEDDMQINATTNSGVGAKGLIAVAAVAGLPSLLTAFMLWKQTPAAPTVPTPAGPADTEYEVRFYDRDGKLIDVPPKK